MLHHARLHLTRVITLIREEALQVEHLVPIHDAEEQGDLRLELADHLAEIVCAVPVEDYELPNPLLRE